MNKFLLRFVLAITCVLASSPQVYAEHIYDWNSKVPARPDESPYGLSAKMRVVSYTGQTGSSLSCFYLPGMGFSRNLLQAILFSGDLTLNTVVPLYLGEHVAEDFALESGCGSFSILFQELAETTLDDAIRRNESFLSKYLSENDGKIAIFGHSKGGSILSHMLRRCQEKSSYMGAEGCSRLSHVMSIGGVPREALMPYMAYGIQNQTLSTNESLRYKTILKAAQVLSRAAGVAIPNMILNSSASEHNPAWIETSPFAQVEGRPVGELFHKDFSFEKGQGWNRARYGSIGVKRTFIGDFYSDIDPMNACPLSGTLNLAMCTFYEQMNAFFHQKSLESKLHFGRRYVYLQHFKVDPRRDQEVWDIYSYGDGQADYVPSMGLCMSAKNGYCVGLERGNHFSIALALPESREAMVDFLSDL